VWFIETEELLLEHSNYALLRRDVRQLGIEHIRHFLEIHAWKADATAGDLSATNAFMLTIWSRAFSPGWLNGTYTGVYDAG
jgi:hypothetical protein